MVLSRAMGDWNGDGERGLSPPGGPTMPNAYNIAVIAAGHDGRVTAARTVWRTPSAAALVCSLLLSGAARADDRPAGRFLDLTRGGKPAATLVAPDDEAPVWADAIARITSAA